MIKSHACELSDNIIYYLSPVNVPAQQIDFKYGIFIHDCFDYSRTRFFVHCYFNC